MTRAISVASLANEVLKQVVGQYKEKTKVILEQCVCGPGEAVRRELLSGQTRRFKETDENTALIGTDGLDYGNHHGRERLREDLSDLPEELCACCSWTILTPQKCWFKSRDPLPRPPLLYRHTKPPTSGIPEDWHCQQDQMKWDLGGPCAQRVKINRPDVWICECGCGSDLRGCLVNV